MRASANKLSEFSKPEEIASVGLQCVREIFPARETESDLAVRLRIEMLTDIVVEVGAERFLAAVKKAITISNNRFDCTIKKIREAAGLRYAPDPSPAHKAWQLVVEVVQKHVRRGPEGSFRLEPYYAIDGQYEDPAAASIYPVPLIPEPTLRAVRCIGGWGALAVCPPEFWHQKLKDFVSVYDESEV
jgi:hypothetical protein